jgi:hypothetical protein
MKLKLFVAIVLLAPLAAAAQVQYRSGGVGEDQQLALEQARRDYPLGLTFSQGARGEWLADVLVTITDKAGAKVLEAVSEGPIMLVNLPAGEYSVRAEANGRTFQRPAKVTPGAHTRLSFNWAAG